jgi:hypothetical protein
VSSFARVQATWQTSFEPGVLGCAGHESAATSERSRHSLCGIDVTLEARCADLEQSTDAYRGGFVVSGGHHAMEADSSSTGGREARERGEA